MADKVKTPVEGGLTNKQILALITENRNLKYNKLLENELQFRNEVLVLLNQSLTNIEKVVIEVEKLKQGLNNVGLIVAEIAKKEGDESDDESDEEIENDEAEEEQEEAEEESEAVEEEEAEEVEEPVKPKVQIQKSGIPKLVPKKVAA